MRPARRGKGHIGALRDRIKIPIRTIIEKMKIEEIESSSTSHFYVDVKVTVDLIPFPSVESGTLPKGTSDGVLYQDNERHRQSLLKFLVLSVDFLAGLHSAKLDPKANALSTGTVSIEIRDIGVWDVGTTHKVSNGLFRKATRFQAGCCFQVRFAAIDLSDSGVLAARTMTSTYLAALHERTGLIQKLESLHIQNMKDAHQLQDLYPYGPLGSPLRHLLTKEPNRE